MKKKPPPPPDARKHVTGGPAGRAPGKGTDPGGRHAGATGAKGGGDSHGKDKDKDRD